MRASRAAERGQLLPMWSMGVIATLVLAFLALNYANSVRWQIRAQNAADSAAQAVVGIQAERWNMMTELLYASNVEEYRIRRQLDSMLLATNFSGGCSMDIGGQYSPLVEYRGPNFYSTNEGTCNRAYIDEHDNFLRAVNRYTKDVGLLHSVAYQATRTNWQSDATSLLSTFQTAGNCNTVNQSTPSNTGGDCFLKYSFAPNGIATRTGLQAVEMDAQGLLVPGLGHYSAKPNIVDSENPALFGPVQVDVVTCAKVPPIIPNFGPFHLQTYYAIGRAAATDVMIEGDWMQPGAVCDPQRGSCPYGGTSTPFQAPELYTQAFQDTSDNDYDWYDVDFGGNATTAYPNYTLFDAPLYGDEMSVQFGWWNAIPAKPFGGAVNLSTSC
jgi:hypothetical protein